VWGLLITLLCGSVHAQEPADPNAVVTNLGFGLVYRNGLYRGNDDVAFPIPLIFLQRGQFYIQGRTAGYRLAESDALSFDLIGQWRFDGYDEDDSRDLSGMGDRDMTIEGGAALYYRDGWGVTRLSLVNDLLGKHKGQEAALSYSRQFTRNDWSFLPSAGLLWLSDNLTDYYYGVDSKYARPGRAAYAAGDALNPFLSLSTNYRFNAKWSAMAQVRYEFLDSEITDSPIVDDHYRLTVMTGLICKF